MKKMNSTLTKIDYSSLIDPLCIPIIQYLREIRGVDTLFCCQGRSKDDPEGSNHSYRGYISAHLGEESKKILSQIYELESRRWKHKTDPRRNPKFEIKEDKGRVTFWMAWRKWNTSEELKKEWKLILKHLKENE